MNTSASKRNRPSLAARAEAAAWIARLHGPNRTPEAEAGFRRWLSEDPERAAAFELLTDTWEKSARLRRRPFERVASWELPGFRLSFSRAAIATALVAVLAVIGTVFYLRTDGLSTGVGEQRTVTLEDGTRVYLNTDTRISRQYDKRARYVELVKGEALFEVAKNPNWPFIVTAGDRQVRALGTAFVVRREEQKLAVTLVEGKVTVTPVAASISRLPSAEYAAEPEDGSSAAAWKANRVAPSGDAASGVERQRSRAAKSSAGSRSAEAFILSPGERLTFVSAQPPQLDTPPLDRVIAWQRGQVSLDNTPLADAVAEMNRYSKVRVVIEDPQVAAISVSGVFRVGDSESFAQAVAQTYRLAVTERHNEITLSRPAPER